MRRLASTIVVLTVLCGAGGCATNGLVGEPGQSTPSRRTTVHRDAQRSIRGTLSTPAEPSGDKPASLAQAVVYIENVPGESAAPATHARISATERGFTPYVLAVAVGTTVDIQNRDQVFHNAFSISPAKHFDVGKIAPGESRSVTFGKPGVVNLFCELHPNATSFVIVLPNEAFTKADASGAFALPPLPNGTYTVRAWHPNYGERRCRVNLDGSGDVTVNLRF